MTPGESDLGDLPERFDELAALAAKVREQSNAQIGAEVAALELRTQAARRSIVWKSALLIPLTIIAIIAVTLAVGRPLRQLDRAISELGSGTLSRPIAVAGPQDLERVGRQLEVAARPPPGPGAGTQPIPATHVARAEDSARQHPRGHGAADGRRRRRARRQSTGGHGNLAGEWRSSCSGSSRTCCPSAPGRPRARRSTRASSACARS